MPKGVMVIVEILTARLKHKSGLGLKRRGTHPRDIHYATDVLFATNIVPLILREIHNEHALNRSTVSLESQLNLS